MEDVVHRADTLALYDAQAPHHDASDFQPVLDSLEMLFPGSGPLVERLAEFRSDFIIPPERVDTVFHTAIDEARRRTAAHLALPPNEEFVLEFVTGPRTHKVEAKRVYEAFPYVQRSDYLSP